MFDFVRAYVYRDYSIDKINMILWQIQMQKKTAPFKLKDIIKCNVYCLSDNTTKHFVKFN